MKKIFKALTLYLKDWRNLLTHGLIGAGILSLALFIPVKPVYRITGLILVVAFNVLRMRLSRKHNVPEPEMGVTD